VQVDTGGKTKNEKHEQLSLFRSLPLVCSGVDSRTAESYVTAIKIGSTIGNRFIVKDISGFKSSSSTTIIQ